MVNLLIVQNAQGRGAATPQATTLREQPGSWRMTRPARDRKRGLAHTSKRHQQSFVKLPFEKIDGQRTRDLGILGTPANPVNVTISHNNNEHKLPNQLLREKIITTQSLVGSWSRGGGEVAIPLNHCWISYDGKRHASATEDPEKSTCCRIPRTRQHIFHTLSTKTKSACSRHSKKEEGGKYTSLQLDHSWTVADEQRISRFLTPYTAKTVRARSEYV